ncbi:uncharacterized protein METZ01_LOCUS218323 [marine metagenome]|uniref:Uncharacterized protein n=1 Tax=marine metagenome TaxID=408172 RepID=A0A382FS34_9ZZZZ
MTSPTSITKVSAPNLSVALLAAQAANRFDLDCGILFTRDEY